MDLRKLKSLIDLVSESDISELEISEGDDKVKIVKEKKQIQKISYDSKKPDFDQSFTNEKPKLEKEFSEYPENQKIIFSPMVGTFYRAPSPESKPFVEINQNIKKGDTLCVIEAMKLMNEVPSNYSGRILEVFVENGEPVEFEQPLFTLEIEN